ncbi:MAG: amidase [Rhizobiaceae bacterium]
MKHPIFTGPELCSLPARDAVELLRKKEVSPAEMLDAAFERIAQVEPAVNAVVATCEDRARNAIKRLAEDERVNGGEAGWLAGLPIAIKDLTMVSGVRTTFGNVALKDFVPDVNDPLVEMMERRGAVVVGKTNTPEFGAGGNTFNDVYGYTRNPWDIRKNAGGSSGGAAVSLATGEVWLSQGSDLAGSARTPAGYCGIVGLRPSPGRCGGGPAATAFSTEGISGPMARDVRDIALFLDNMAGFIPEMPITLEAPQTPFQKAVERADGKVRIAFSEDQGGFAPVDREIRAVLRSAMEKVAGSGGVVEDDCPELPGLYDTYVTLRGIHYGSVNAYLPEEVQSHFKQTLKQNTDFGSVMTSRQIFDALRQRTVLYQAMRVFLKNYDALAIPVAGIEPGLVEEEYPLIVDGEPVQDYVDWLRFSFLSTTTGLPAIVVPVGFTNSGMPVGLQLIGQPRGEARLLSTASAVEAAVGFPATPIDPINPA